MKYRIYRQLSKIQYKDVEAKNIKEAHKCCNDIGEGFTNVDSGYVTNVWIDTDLTKEKRLADLIIMNK